MTAKAYYYYGTSGWTSSVLQDYGGSLTWVQLQSCGDHLSWSLTDGQLTVLGTGDMLNYSAGNLPPWYGRRGEITSVYLSNFTVEGIGAYAFYNCTNLTRVLVGVNVARIGNYAFRGCTALQDVVFLGSAPAFAANAFYNVTVTAHYPATDSSWTAFLWRASQISE